MKVRIIFLQTFDFFFPASLEVRSQAPPRRWRPGPGRSMERPGISWRRYSKYFKYSFKYGASSWIKGRTIIYMWLKYQGGGQRLRHPPPLCLSQDRPTWLPHQRHQVELHQVPHQQGGQASGKVGGREVQYLYFRNSNQLLRFGPNDSVVPTVEAEIQKLL